LFSDDNRLPPGHCKLEPANYAIHDAWYFKELLDLHGIAKGSPSRTGRLTD